MTDQQITTQIKKFEKLATLIWYNISNRPDKEDLIQVIKLMIDCHRVFGGDEYVLSNDYAKFKIVKAETPKQAI